MPLMRGRSDLENLTLSALLCEQMQNEKVSDDEKKQDRHNIAPLSLHCAAINLWIIEFRHFCFISFSFVSFSW